MDTKYHFTFVSDAQECGIVIYDKKTGKELQRKAFSEEERIGRLHRMDLEIAEKTFLYQFYDDGGFMPDPLGREFVCAKKYGEEKEPEDVFTVVQPEEFDWQESRNPRLDYSDSLVYCLHVRGFTKHASSKVCAKGTFLGVVEKIPYLREIGVTTLEFQPIYEFLERPAPWKKIPQQRMSSGEESPRPQPLNYWGYAPGYYFAPKADYASGNPVRECKEMIRELHKNGMEVVLQFFFPAKYNPMEIPQVLRFWVEEYHVDGFHLIGENLPAQLLARDPMLSETKIWYYQMEDSPAYERNDTVGSKTLGLVNDAFMYDGRRFLKGDENCVSSMMYHMKTLPARIGRIHYLSNYCGFTLMDMVSYNYKHNEANLENNHDGGDYNCSWNCGEEGFSRRKKVIKLRVQQMKNAYCLLFFSQSTPRIFMGDEFGNSQKGNNNPYCQDNAIAWLNWRDLEKNREMYVFFKLLSKLRFSLPMLHPEREATMMDHLSCGYPDLSFHGQTAWRPQTEGYSRQLGVLYCGMQGKEGEEKDADDGPLLYLAMNMYWEPHDLGLPRPPRGRKWELVFSTCEEQIKWKDEKNRSDRFVPADPDVVNIPGKTVALFHCVNQESKDELRRA